jgi:hypothetical protein
LQRRQKFLMIADLPFLLVAAVLIPLIFAFSRRSAFDQITGDLSDPLCFYHPIVVVAIFRYAGPEYMETNTFPLLASRLVSGALERRVALGHHRYEWVYVTAFVAPASGETVWFLSNGIDKPFFASLSCSKPSHATPAPDATASSSFSSTMLAGTRRKTCPSRTASGPFNSQPTPRNCSRPNTSGHSSTSHSPTSTSKPSMISMPSSLCDAET